MTIEKVTKEIFETVETKFHEVKDEVQEMKDDLHELQQRSVGGEAVKQKVKQKSYDLKGFMNSDFQNFGDYARTQAEKKGLPLNGNDALYISELNTDVIEQSIVNNAILNSIGKQATANLDYRRTVLSARPEAKLTKENTTFASVANTESQDYTTLSGLFTKMYSYPEFTYEATQFAEFSVENDAMKLISEDFAITMQDQILNGNGLVDGDGNQHLVGIANAAIDRANSYAGALMPTGTRDRGLFQAVKTSDADGIGDTVEAIEANLYSLMLSVPERSQASSKFAMHPNTLGFLMQTLKDTQGRSLFDMELTLENGVWVRRVSLFGAPVILNESMDELGAGNAPIIFGDFEAGYDLLLPGNAQNMFVRDIYTKPDVVRLYMASWFGGMVTDHEALAVLVCIA